MIIIAGTFSIDPTKREKALEIAQGLCTASEAEPGCISYSIYADPHDPAQFFIFEEWQDEAALEAHFQTPHMADFQPQFSSIGVTDFSGIKRYNATPA